MEYNFPPNSLISWEILVCQSKGVKSAFIFEEKFSEYFNCNGLNIFFGLKSSFLELEKSNLHQNKGQDKRLSNLHFKLTRT